MRSPGLSQMMANDGEWASIVKEIKFLKKVVEPSESCAMKVQLYSKNLEATGLKLGLNSFRNYCNTRTNKTVDKAGSLH